MFIGHYGIALAAKAVHPEAPLPMLMLSTQLIDVVWSGLVLAKVERVEIDASATPTVPLRLTYMPYSHSLIGAVVLSVLSAVLAILIYGDLAAMTLGVIALVCFSHWLLDLIVHDRDMPIIGNRFHVGFGLWHHKTSAITLEFAVILVGLAVLGIADIVTFWKLALAGAILVAIQCISFFTTPPSTPGKLATSMLIVFFGMIGLGAWLEY